MPKVKFVKATPEQLTKSMRPQDHLVDLPLFKPDLFAPPGEMKTGRMKINQEVTTDSTGRAHFGGLVSISFDVEGTPAQIAKALQLRMGEIAKDLPPGELRMRLKATVGRTQEQRKR